MLSSDQVKAIWIRLEELKCVSPKLGNDLFTFVFLGEPPDQRLRFESHLLKCEYCRISLELYRHQRDSGKVLIEYLELGKKIIEEAKAGNAAIVIKTLLSGMAYFEPSDQGDLGLTVIVNSDGEISSVEEGLRTDFEKLQ